MENKLKNIAQKEKQESDFFASNIKHLIKLRKYYQKYAHKALAYGFEELYHKSRQEQIECIRLLKAILSIEHRVLLDEQKSNSSPAEFKAEEKMKDEFRKIAIEAKDNILTGNLTQYKNRDGEENLLNRELMDAKRQQGINGLVNAFSEDEDVQLSEKQLEAVAAFLRSVQDGTKINETDAEKIKRLKAEKKAAKKNSKQKTEKPSDNNPVEEE